MFWVRASHVGGFASYYREELYTRSASLFVVVLGVGKSSSFRRRAVFNSTLGLDKITNNFHFVVGSPGFGAANVGITLAFVVIVIGKSSSVMNLLTYVYPEASQDSSFSTSLKEELCKGARIEPCSISLHISR